MEKVRMFFDVSPAHAARLQDYAERTGETLSSLADGIFAEWFADLDADSRAADEAYAEFIAGGGKTYTQKEVFGEPAA